MRTTLTASVLLAVIASLGCSARLIDFTVLSSKNARVEGEVYGKRTEGKDCAGLLLGLIPVTGRFQPNMKEAVDRAIEKAGVGYDALIDGVVDNQVLLLFVYNQSCYIVEGTPINTKKASTGSLDDRDGVYRHSRR